VVACAAALVSVCSATTATAPVAPGAASDPVVATTVTACGVRINWQVPTDNGGKPIMYYNVYATGGGTQDKKMKIVEGSATTTTFVTGLKKRTQYSFQVSAVNEIGESPLGTDTEAVTTQDFRKYLFVSDFSNDRILRFDWAVKSFKDVFVQKGSGGLRKPWGIAFNKFDDSAQPRTFYVASEGTSSILQYDACDGSFVKTFAVVPGEPRGLKFHILPSAHKTPRQQKMLVVASHYGHSLLKYNAYTGSPLGTYSTGVKHPGDFVIGPQSTSTLRAAEDVFVTSMTGNAVNQFQNTSGAFKSTWTDKKINTAYGIAFGQDCSWNPSGAIVTDAADSVQTGYLYVTGPYAGKVIVKFDQNNGTYIEHFEDRDLQAPMGLVYYDATLYVLDHNTIRTYDAETGEFLEVFTSHDGMDGTYLLFHDM